MNSIEGSTAFRSFVWYHYAWNCWEMLITLWWEFRILLTSAVSYKIKSTYHAIYNKEAFNHCLSVLKLRTPSIEGVHPHHYFLKYVDIFSIHKLYIYNLSNSTKCFSPCFLVLHTISYWVFLDHLKMFLGKLFSSILLLLILFTLVSELLCLIINVTLHPNF